VFSIKHHPGAYCGCEKKCRGKRRAVKKRILPCTHGDQSQNNGSPVRISPVHLVHKSCFGQAADAVLCEFGLHVQRRAPTLVDALERVAAHLISLYHSLLLSFTFVLLFDGVVRVLDMLA
jgi:hypothetical protein